MVFLNVWNDPEMTVGFSKPLDNSGSHGSGLEGQVSLR